MCRTRARLKETYGTKPFFFLPVNLSKPSFLLLVCSPLFEVPSALAWPVSLGDLSRRAVLLFLSCVLEPLARMCPFLGLRFLVWLVWLGELYYWVLWRRLILLGRLGLVC